MLEVCCGFLILNEASILTLRIIVFLTNFLLILVKKINSDCPLYKYTGIRMIVQTLESQSLVKIIYLTEIMIELTI